MAMITVVDMPESEADSCSYGSSYENTSESSSESSSESGSEASGSTEMPNPYSFEPSSSDSGDSLASAPGPLLFLVLRGPGTRKYVI